MNSIMSAVRRKARKNRILHEKMKKDNWKIGRETHQVTMTPRSWYTVNEICKEDHITPGEFFENMILSFMRWYVKESRNRKFSDKYNHDDSGTISDVLAEVFYERKMDILMFDKYDFNIESMPDIDEFPEWSQTVMIEVEKTIITLLQRAVSKKFNTINPKLPKEIEKAIYMYIKHIEDLNY